MAWFKKLDQFDGIEAVRSILNSLRRGGDSFWIFYSFNPPRTMWSWVNVESLGEVTGTGGTFTSASTWRGRCG